MKKIYITFLLIWCSLLGMAQGGQPAPTSSDPAAKAILDGVNSKFKTFKTVQAGFIYKVENAAGKAMSTKNGTLYMKGTKYKVNFAGQEIFCDGKTIWNYDKSENEVRISKVDPSGSMITPQKLFTNFYDKDFLYMLNGEKKVGTKTVQEIELTPVDKGRSYHKVYVQIDKSNKTIYSTKVLENAGNRYTYTVSSLKTNITLADNLFIFDKSKYPGVEVVDLD